jgi:uncharacterized protein YbjT (DUF2867 family)
MAQESEKADRRVLVTGGSGFVGRYVVRELIARAYHPVCLVRSPDRLMRALSQADPTTYSVVEGDLFDEDALTRAAGDAQAVIHLVGLIMERRWRAQSFRRIHLEGTRRVIEAARKAGIRRYVHMSALGSRAQAVSTYHRTKWEAESLVRGSDLAWTIFRPSVIHGPDGEFMELMKWFVCGLVPPMIVYFGDGQKRVQPVSVRDVAHCFVAALRTEATIGKTIELGGPRAYSWRELYETCRRLIPGASRIKPAVGMPLLIAKAVGFAGDVADRLTPFRFGIPFNLAQVQMSQEDSVCEVGLMEETFGIRPRDFEKELAAYGGQIR